MNQEIAKTIELAYRVHWGELTAILSRQFGSKQLDLVETVVQEAFVKAMERWPSEGVPEKPVAWLLTVARNLRLNQARNQSTSGRLEEQITHHIEHVTDHVTECDKVTLASEILDDELRMIFVCNHPLIADDARIPLTLRTLCGFETIELARAYLISEDAIKKRLVRARAQLREANVELDLPSSQELVNRLDSVLATLYVLFTEGYSPHDGDEHIRRDLAAEAMRLGEILGSHPLTQNPRVHALLALMCFQSSRFETRIDAAGSIVLLKDQNRSLWDQAKIRRGFLYLAESAKGEDLSRYHIEASIAACHARAVDFVSTDWKMIAQLYEMLVHEFQSEVATVGHAVAVGYAEGASKGIKLLKLLAKKSSLSKYGPLHAALADFLESEGKISEARLALAKALELASTKPERRHLQTKIESLNR